MPITFNANTVNVVIFNNTDLDKVTFNGNTVFEKQNGSKFYFTLTSEDIPLILHAYQSSPTGVTIDWGDGSPLESTNNIYITASHSYSEPGDYVVTFYCASGETWTPGDINKIYTFCGSANTNSNKLKAFTLDTSVNTIGEDAFNRELGLTIINIPNSISTLKSYAFANCGNVTDVHLGNGITIVESNCFQSNVSTKNIYLDNIVSYCAIPFVSATTELFWAGTTALSAMKNVYINNVLQTTLVIPSNVSFIPTVRLGKLNCTNLEVGAIELGERCFATSKGVEKIWIRNTTTTINASAANYSPFLNCDNVTTIYCEATEKPAGWSEYWNYKNASTTIPVVWGQTTSPF